MSKLLDEIKKIKEIKAPEWAAFVKTGTSKERPPIQDDWWEIRATSVLNKINKLGPVGTNRLAKQYGSRKNRGHKKDIKCSGSRNIVRKILQQLEEAGLIKQVKEPSSGRIVTKKGRELINKGEN
jgi:small subunit ribosomal protein S19e